MFTNKKGELELEDDDQCVKCEYINKGIACPLIEALVTQVVGLHPDGITVQNCGFFTPYERHLKAVPKNDSGNKKKPRA